MIEDELQQAMRSRAKPGGAGRERLYKAQLEATRRRKRRDTVGAAIGGSAFTFLAVFGVMGASNGNITGDQPGSATANLATQIEASAPVDPTEASRRRPPVIVGASAAGRLVLIDSQTGRTTKVLTVEKDPSNSEKGRLGTSVTVGGKRIFFEVQGPQVCNSEIRVTDESGSTPTRLLDGSTPAISPDGTQLAYFRQVDCRQSEVVVRTLATGAEKVVASSGGVGAVQPERLAALSWSPDAASIVADLRYENYANNSLMRFSTDATTSFEEATKIRPVSAPEGTLWENAAFLPDGRLFLSERCCNPSESVSEDMTSRMVVVNINDRSVTEVVALGVTTKTHTSTDSDEAGAHLLYLSGQDLMVSDDMERPAPIAFGLIGATWLE